MTSLQTITFRTFAERLTKHGTAALAVMVLAFAWASPAFSYPTWSSNSTTNTGNCATCHGDFQAPGYTSNTADDPAAWGSDLMTGHVSQYGLGCNDCHITPFAAPVTLNSAASGVTCVSCHGRVEDILPGGGDGAFGGPGPGSGDGLRAHHELKVGPFTCSGCHSADQLPVGENIKPPQFIVLGLDPCTNVKYGNYGLDNDGDGPRDGNDIDCVPPTTTTTAAPTTTTTTAAPTTTTTTAAPTTTTTTAAPTTTTAAPTTTTAAPTTTTAAPTTTTLKPTTTTAAPTTTTRAPTTTTAAPTTTTLKPTTTTAAPTTTTAAPTTTTRAPTTTTAAPTTTTRAPTTTTAAPTTTTAAPTTTTAAPTTTTTLPPGQCPTATVVIDGCDSGVPNQQTDGSCLSDLVDACAADADNHGDYVSCVAKATKGIKGRSAIVRCAAQSDIGKDNSDDSDSGD